MAPDIAESIQDAVEDRVTYHENEAAAKANGRPFAACTSCWHGVGPATGYCRRCISLALAEEPEQRDAALALLPARMVS